jgi:vancomycin resistance protein YoaR
VPTNPDHDVVSKTRGRTLPEVPRRLGSWWRAAGWKRFAARAGAGAGLLLFILVGVWAVDAIRTNGQVARNVTLAGRDVSNMDDGQLSAVVDEIASSYRSTPVEIQTDTGSIQTTAGDLGLAIDEAGTIAKARSTGKASAFYPLRPFEWLGSWFHDSEAPVVFHVDDDQARSVVSQLADQVARPPVEPSIASNDGHLAVVPGVDGARLDPEAVLQALRPGAGFDDGKFVAEVETTPVPPTTSDDSLEALVDEADRRSKAGLELTVPGVDGSIAVPSDTIAGWWKVTPAATPGTPPTLGVDDAKVQTDVQALVGERGTVRNDPGFAVVDGQVQVTPPAPGTVCCVPATAKAVDTALLGLQPGTTVAVTMKPTDPADDLARAQALGIKEEISTFTTKHQCCQNRVSNIHRIADIIRGHVIKPGETFSINDFVGKRTVENGFLVDHVIEDGEFREDVGGGISQFATTMFNAAFFGGLDFVEYQSHTLYIDRYPYGREATLSYPHPDLKVTNPTPYGILIWPTYNGTSITVTLYSTKYATVEQTGQDKTPSEQCTRVTTHRRRTYPDGHVVDDETHAFYQPGENLNCQGQLINTTTTTSTTTTTTTTDPNASTTSAPPGAAPPGPASGTSPATTPPTAPVAATTTGPRPPSGP